MAWSKKDVVVAALLLCLTAVLLYRVVPYFQVFDVEVGERAPDFNLTADDGSGFRLDDYHGKVVLLNFWATWCPPCVQEMPSLNRLHERLQDKGFVVLGVSVDQEREAYQQFLQQVHVSFPTVRDPERGAASRYGTMKYPESYLINREGIVMRKYIGEENWDRPEILNYLSSIL
jgi:cytochrome c biogenesis protein CcmG, thiol:disulfide interchange protein DsbE